jgi:pimeloyl-ACP methyl ester carboxylesterase
MGGAVATGFAAKYPTLCASLVLIAPIGVNYTALKREKMLHKKYIGEYLIFNGQTNLINAQEKDFFDHSATSPSQKEIELQTNMIKWQIDYTPGYLGTLLSTYRLFPLRGMEELYSAVGRHPRPVMIVWGDKDEVCPYKKCVRKMEGSFPYSCIIDVKNCGHSCIAEKFDEVVTELLSFHKEIFTEDVDEDGIDIDVDI